MKPHSHEEHIQHSFDAKRYCGTKRVPVTAEERAMIERKMQQMGMGCFSVYARKMLIDGYVIRLDYNDVKAMTADKLLVSSFGCAVENRRP